MKKLFITIITGVLALSLVGCGSTINFRGTPQQEMADSVIGEKYPDAVFSEMVESEDGERYTFFYEVQYESESTTVKYETITYTVEAYHGEGGEWLYSQAEQIDERYEWENIEGVWYSVLGEYTNNLLYRNCIMKIGKIENNQVHITFTKDDKVCFNDTIDFHDIDGTSFNVNWEQSGWQDFTVYIDSDGIHAAAKNNSMAGGCWFER